MSGKVTFSYVETSNGKLCLTSNVVSQAQKLFRQHHGQDMARKDLMLAGISFLSPVIGQEVASPECDLNIDWNTSGSPYDKFSDAQLDITNHVIDAIGTSTSKLKKSPDDDKEKAILSILKSFSLELFSAMNSHRQGYEITFTESANSLFGYSSLPNTQLAKLKPWQLKSINAMVTKARLASAKASSRSLQALSKLSKTILDLVEEGTSSDDNFRTYRNAIPVYIQSLQKLTTLHTLLKSAERMIDAEESKPDDYKSHTLKILLSPLMEETLMELEAKEALEAPLESLSLNDDLPSLVSKEDTGEESTSRLQTEKNKSVDRGTVVSPDEDVTRLNTSFEETDPEAEGGWTTVGSPKRIPKAAYHQTSKPSNSTRGWILPIAYDYSEQARLIGKKLNRLDYLAWRLDQMQLTDETTGGQSHQARAKPFIGGNVSEFGSIKLTVPRESEVDDETKARIAEVVDITQQRIAATNLEREEFERSLNSGD